MRQLKLFLAPILALLPTACLEITQTVPVTPSYGLELTLSCIPEDGALIAAHRGTTRGSRHPENSMSALESLITSRVVMAEIDVARTRDGVHILYHDGVWDDGTNGSGAVAATDYATVRTFSLRDGEGRVTDDGVPTFREYIARAKGELFLEIDFKSSADYADVIAIIEEYGMTDFVILIAYTNAQARALRRLAPRMFISAPKNEAQGIAPPTLTWLGGDITDTNGYAIGRIGTDRHSARGLAKLRAYDIAVTDFATSEDAIAGLDRRGWEAFDACIRDKTES